LCCPNRTPDKLICAEIHAPNATYQCERPNYRLHVKGAKGVSYYISERRIMRNGDNNKKRKKEKGKERKTTLHHVRMMRHRVAQRPARTLRLHPPNVRLSNRPPCIMRDTSCSRTISQDSPSATRPSLPTTRLAIPMTLSS
jgi:hypothetical protein